MRGYQQILKLFDVWDGRDDEIPFGELVESLAGLALERADLASAITFADRNYRRITVRRRPHYEALVLCWKSGQRSPIHNRLGSSCVVRGIEGEATETHYVFTPCGRLVPQQSHTYSAGSVTGCRDEAIHQMANLQAPGQELITLHVYSPPPSSSNYFKLDLTTLADHNILLSEGNQSVLVDFGRITRTDELSAIGCGFDSPGHAIGFRDDSRSPCDQLHRTSARCFRRALRLAAILDRTRHRPPWPARARTGRLRFGCSDRSRWPRARPHLRHRPSAQGTIPHSTLTQIMLKLKGAGLVRSSRGAEGGYRLARPPEEIELGQILRLIDGDNGVQRELRGPCAQILASVWHQIREFETQVLAQTSIAELAGRLASLNCVI